MNERRVVDEKNEKSLKKNKKTKIILKKFNGKTPRYEVNALLYSSHLG